MWNFAGREGDIQDADWMSPLAVFKDVPDAISNNKGRNTLFYDSISFRIHWSPFQLHNG